MRWKCSLVVGALAGLAAIAPGRAEEDPPNKHEPSFELSDATREPERSGEVAAEPARPLSEEATRALLDRLPLPETGEAAPVAPPASTPPPPGARLVEGPPEPIRGPAAQESPRALTIIRRTPEGAVEVAPNLAVVFGEPMVPLASDEDLARETVPVRLGPEPPGRWRWLDTRTLLFEPEGRFPMATRYAIEVAQGTRSVAGNVLDEPVCWTFETPPPKVLAWHPERGPVSRQPLILIGFDQRVDRRAVMARLKVDVDGHSSSVREATEAEIAKDETARELSFALGDGRWIALRPTEPFPPRAMVSVRLESGLASAEGPRTTGAVQQRGFRVRDTLELVGQVSQRHAGWAELVFSNELDREAFDPAWVRVDPAVEDLKPWVQRDRLVLGGHPRLGLTYRVRVSAALRDRFGQALGREASVTIETQRPRRNASLWLAREPVAVADPLRPSVSVFSQNLRSFRLRTYAVEPSAWPRFWRWLHESSQKADAEAPLGRPTLDERVEVSPGGDTPVETRIDLSSALCARHGHLVVIADAGNKDRDVYIVPLSPRIARLARAPSARALAWVQATQIGLEVTADRDALLVWASSLADGRPLAGAEVELFPTGTKALTNASGLARLERGEAQADIVVARLAGDVAILPLSDGRPDWIRSRPFDPLRWYVADDRGLYRPGEEVHVKGYLRQRDRLGALRPLDPVVADRVDYVLSDASSNEILKGGAPINRFGAFDLVLPLPEVMALGKASLRLEARPGCEGSSAHDHGLQVEEFRRPEFELGGHLSDTPVVAGESVVATIEARYFSGGGLADAKTRWEVRASQPVWRPFVPPGRQGFHFSAETAWDDERRVLEARTNGEGESALRIATLAVGARAAREVWLTASVEDLSGQTWTADGTFVILPSRALVGVKTERSLVPQGQPVKVDMIVVDPRGAALPDRRVSVRAESRDWRQVRGEWQWVTVSTEERIVTSAAVPTTCAFTPQLGGQLRLTAVVADDEGREHESGTTVWVAGKGFRGKGARRDAASLTADKEEYHPGEVARLVVASPFAPAQGLLTLRRRSVVHSQPFEMTERTHTLSVPIDESWMPGLEAHVELLSPDLRAGATPEPTHPLSVDPATASADTQITISRETRRLAIEIRPRDEVLVPGGETAIEVSVRDAAGQPVAGAEAALWAVDEAVLALLPHDLDHPTDTLNPEERAWSVDDLSLLDHLDLASPHTLERLAALRGRRGLSRFSRLAPGAMPRWGGLLTSTGAREGLIERVLSLVEPRKHFSPLAFFLPSIVTGSDGSTSVTIRLPDNLTRYRLFGLATDGHLRFGLGGGATLTARLPLMARPSPPRFLNRGDAFDLPVVVQNDTGAALDVDVAVRAIGLRLTKGAGRSVTVSPEGRAAVRFPAVAERAGETALTIVAASGDLHDSAELTVPVKVPVRMEHIAVYGKVDDDQPVRQVVQTPHDALPDVGGLDVSLAPSALQGLSDVVLDLANYQYECAEQISSRVLGISALQDVLGALEVPGLPPADQLSARVQREVQRISTLQNYDGGFGFWRRGERSWPYVTIHVAHALVRARDKGFSVPSYVLESVQEYLEDIDQRTPGHYSLEARRALRAYALYVLHLLGEPTAPDARGLVRGVGVEQLPIEALGWLLPALADDPGSAAEVRAIVNHLGNRVTETAGQAHFVTAYEDGAHLLLHSDRRTDAVLLDGLLAADPTSDLIPKLAAGLLARLGRGARTSAQEDAFVLLALDRYFERFESTPPDFVARLWWGPSLERETRFHGLAGPSESVTIPMSRLDGDGSAQALILARQGQGRLYYRVALRHASSRMDRAPLDHGFAVSRAYRAVDDAHDVQHRQDGAWRLRVGARVRIRVTLVVSAVRHHVALVDPLPAGLEPLNPLLPISGGDTPPDDDEEVPLHGPPGAWRTWAWVDHQNLRDDRAEAFAATLRPGVYQFEYMARATTRGHFIAPAPHAEEMYTPETRGRGAVDDVVVE